MTVVEAALTTAVILLIALFWLHFIWVPEAAEHGRRDRANGSYRHDWHRGIPRLAYNWHRHGGGDGMKARRRRAREERVRRREWQRPREGTVIHSETPPSASDMHPSNLWIKSSTGEAFAFDPRRARWRAVRMDMPKEPKK